MMNLIIALVLMQNVTSFDGNKSNPNFDRMDKAMKVVRIINGIK